MSLYTLVHKEESLATESWSENDGDLPDFNFDKENNISVSLSPSK